MSDHLKTIRSWRLAGLTFSAIQDRCIEHGYTTTIGTIPTIKTICLWCKGIPRPIKEKRRTRPYDPNTPPRMRIDQHPQNKGLRELIFKLRSEGISLRLITKQVEQDGFTTTKGTPIRKTQILRILKRPLSKAELNI